jgi:thiol-disulfide isomerase/thioredoxin
MKKTLQIILLILSESITYAQSEPNGVYPKVGNTCPEFELRNIAYYSMKRAILKDFRGKWLVLDFWNKYCGACVSSFPKISTLQKKFGNKVQFMLVGIEDKEGQIQKMYDKFRERENLIMPCAFDSILAKRFDVYTSPYIIIIDEKGIVQGITTSVDSTDMQGFLTGRPPHLRKTYRMQEDVLDERTPYDPQKPFLIRGNGGNDTDFLFRSVFSAWNPLINQQSAPGTIGENNIKEGRFQVLGVPLYWIYNYAYYGENHPDSGYYDYPVLEIRDSSAFQFSYKYAKSIFSYSLIMPTINCTKQHMEETMQRDLENYFGYEAKIEVRKCPYWRLIATEEAKRKLRTKGGPAIYQGLPKASFTALNWPISKLLGFIGNHNDGIFSDETGITGNIDIMMDCILTDLNDVKKALEVNGLDLMLGEKQMQVLVIRDKTVYKIKPL